MICGYFSAGVYRAFNTLSSSLLEFLLLLFRGEGVQVYFREEGELFFWGSSFIYTYIHTRGPKVREVSNEGFRGRRIE